MAPIPGTTGLALALREIGRIERALIALDGLEQPQLRRQATAELNKGESRDALARAVFFHRLGRLHDCTARAQQHRASGLTLVTAAIALWNIVYLSRALEAARLRGNVIPDALLAHLAPLGWQHINLTGDFLWSADAAIKLMASGRSEVRVPGYRQPLRRNVVPGPFHEPWYLWPFYGVPRLSYGQFAMVQKGSGARALCDTVIESWFPRGSAVTDSLSKSPRALCDRLACRFHGHFAMVLIVC